jgi:uncharacterized protein (TIGR04255 family)
MGVSFSLWRRGTIVNPLIKHRRDFGHKAPITEALIDIQASVPQDISLDSLRAFNETLQRFSTVHTQTEWAGQFKVDGADSSTMTTRHGVRGFLFVSDDEKNVVQARRDGFTFSRLYPYEGWDALRDEAKELWKRYVAVSGATGVRRLAVRYINRLPMPSEQVVLGEWLNLHPRLPAGLGPMADFLLRVVLPHPENHAYQAIVTQGTAPPEDDRGPGIMFDIDVFAAFELGSDDPQVWSILEDLRQYKNDVFFGTITNDTERRLLE